VSIDPKRLLEVTRAWSFAEGPNAVTAVHEAAEEIQALRARVAEMEAVLQDFAEHGVRHDLTPTTTLRIGDTDAVHVFYRCYIGSIDQHVRNVARRALTRGVVAITGETR